MRRQTRGQQTRDAVLDATAALITRRPFAMIKLSEIEELAAVTKGALHGQFASKEDIAGELIAVEYAAAYQTVQGRLLDVSPTIESLVVALFESAHYVVEHPRFQSAIQLRLELARGDSPIDVDVWGQWHEFITRLIAQSIVAGDVKPDVEPERFAFVILGALAGVRFLSDLVDQYERLVERVEDTLRYILPSVVVPERLAYFDEFVSRRSVLNKEPFSTGTN